MKKQTTLKASAKPLRSKQTLKKTAMGKKKRRSPVKFEKQTIPRMVGVVDKPFSKYVRLRDSERVDNEWHGTCITCSKTGVVAYIDETTDKLRFVQGWDNGHFVGRGTWITRFEEENCNLQCSYRCNKLRSGEYQKYKAELKNKYGKEVPARLEAMAQEHPDRSYRFSREELIQLRNDCNEYINHAVNGD